MFKIWGTAVRETWIRIPVLAFPSWVILDKLHNFSEPQFCLKNRVNNNNNNV